MKIYFESKRKLNEDKTELSRQFDMAVNQFYERRNEDANYILSEIAERYSESVEDIHGEFTIHKGRIYVTFAYPNPDNIDDVFGKIIRSLEGLVTFVPHKFQQEGSTNDLPQYSIVCVPSPSYDTLKSRLNRKINDAVAKIYSQQIEHINNM